MTDSPTAASPHIAILPYGLPDDPGARLALFTVRRLGAFGLHDAVAANTKLTACGRAFRRPLLLARAFMADVATTATGPIPIAPCCCARMTAAEQALLTVLERVAREPCAARLLLIDLLGNRAVEGVLASAQAFAEALSDAGLPLLAARD